jgi:hypothetical protein
MASSSAMNGARMIGVVLLVLGLLGIFYDKISWTKQRTAVEMGPIEIKVDETRTRTIPLWAAIGVLAVGGALLLAPVSGGGRRLA